MNGMNIDEAGNYLNQRFIWVNPIHLWLNWWDVLPCQRRLQAVKYGTQIEKGGNLHPSFRADAPIGAIIGVGISVKSF